MGAPPGLGRPQQAQGTGMGVQQAGFIDNVVNGQPAQVKLVHLSSLLLSVPALL